MTLLKGKYLFTAIIVSLALSPHPALAGGLSVRIITPPPRYSHDDRYHRPSATFSVGPVTSFSHRSGPVTSFDNPRYHDRGNRNYYPADFNRYPAYNSYPSPAYRYKQRIDYLRGYQQGYRDGYRDSRRW